MKKVLALLILLSFSLLSCKKEVKKEEDYMGIEKAEMHGFQLSMQSFTFFKTPLIDVFEKMQILGVKNLEIYPNHPIGGKWLNRKFNFDLPIGDQLEIKALAAEYGIKIVGFGVYTIKDAKDWELLFSQGKAMQIEYITCEPKYEHLELIAKLSAETGIKVGIHNHPTPSEYATPQLALDHIEQYGDQMGICADVANWNREKLDQIECLEKLAGKIQSVHLSDIDILRRDKDDNLRQEYVRLGTGILDVDAIMIELKRQDFKGYLTLEYPSSVDRQMYNLKDCISYYNLVAEELFK